MKTLSILTHGDFEELGSLATLLTSDPKNSKMQAGADTFLKKSFLHAVYFVEAEKIEDAHSAIHSYWPAPFPTDAKHV